MRAFVAILNCARKLIVVMLFFVTLIIVYAYIGVKIIGDLNGAKYDPVYKFLHN